MKLTASFDPKVIEILKKVLKDNDVPDYYYQIEDTFCEYGNENTLCLCPNEDYTCFELSITERGHKTVEATSINIEHICLMLLYSISSHVNDSKKIITQFLDALVINQLRRP